MNTTYEAVRPLEDGKPVPVVEKDETGALVGAWIGYWSRKRQTVALYPDVKNRFVNWPGGRIPSSRRLVSDMYVKCRERSSSSTVKDGPSSPILGKAGETWRDRKLPMKGQERIKF